MSGAEPLVPLPIVRETAHGAEIILGGELDIAQVEAIALSVSHVAGHGRNIVIDLSAVTFVDSSVVSTLLNAYRLSVVDGWTLQLRPGTERVQQTFAVLGLADYLPFASL
jgi:anti-anti-sigma factor